jgi:hypothetical protein
MGLITVVFMCGDLAEQGDRIIFKGRREKAGLLVSGPPRFGAPLTHIDTPISALWKTCRDSLAIKRGSKTG